MAQRNFGSGALRLIGPTTATGLSDVASISPVQTVTAQVVCATTGATGTFSIQGSLDGSGFVNAIAATTFITGTTGTFVTSTTTHIFTNLRINLSVTGTTKDVSILVAGR
jgi:hypothetical protein